MFRTPVADWAAFFICSWAVVYILVIKAMHEPPNIHPGPGGRSVYIQNHSCVINMDPDTDAMPAAKAEYILAFNMCLKAHEQYMSSP